MQVRETEKMLLISGAVPGANGSYVVVRPALKTGGKAAGTTVAAVPSSQKGTAK